MQITVPAGPNKPMRINVTGREYFLQPGETVNVPDEVVAELLRALGIKHVPPDTQAPWTDAENAKLTTALAALTARVAALEEALPELPAAPDTDGTYGLQLVVDDGAGALSWEAVEATTVDSTET